MRRVGLKEWRVGLKEWPVKCRAECAARWKAGELAEMSAVWEVYLVARWWMRMVERSR